MTPLDNLCIMDYPRFIISDQKEESIIVQRVKSLVFIALLYFVLKMLSAFYICCMYIQVHFGLDFLMESHTMNPDHRPHKVGWKLLIKTTALDSKTLLGIITVK